MIGCPRRRPLLPSLHHERKLAGPQRRMTIRASAISNCCEIVERMEPAELSRQLPNTETTRARPSSLSFCTMLAERSMIRLGLTKLVRLSSSPEDDRVSSFAEFDVSRRGLAGPASSPTPPPATAPPSTARCSGHRRTQGVHGSTRRWRSTRRDHRPPNQLPVRRRRAPHRP